MTVLALVLLTFGSANADTVLFDSESDFLAALGAWQLESFEDVSLGNYNPELYLESSGITITAEHISIRDDFDMGGHPTHGDQYIAAVTP